MPGHARSPHIPANSFASAPAARGASWARRILILDSSPDFDSAVKPSSRLLRISAPEGASRTPATESKRRTAKSSPWRIVMTLRAGSITIAVALVASALAGGSAVAQTRSLYDRLGGYSAISAVVDDFVKNVAADKRINKFFANANIDRLKVRLVEQICQGTGGPCVYTGRDMKSAHAGMGIGRKDFDALVQDVGKRLKQLQVQERGQREPGPVM